MIFFTSKRETGIESSINWRNKIKSNLQDCDIFVALITTNFKNSEMCMGEIGAAWVLNKRIYPLILPPIKYENFSPLIAELQADLLLSRDDIQSFIGSLQLQLMKLYGIDVQDGINTEKSINEFLKSTKNYLHKHPDLFHSQSAVENQEQRTIKEIRAIFDNADVSVGDHEKELIKQRSKKEWPSDYSMQEHYIEEQIRALTEITKLKNEVKSDIDKYNIVERAIRDWPTDYTMQIHRANEEINAYKRLR